MLNQREYPKAMAGIAVRKTDDHWFIKLDDGRELSLGKYAWPHPDLRPGYHEGVRIVARVNPEGTIPPAKFMSFER